MTSNLENKYLHKDNTPQKIGVIEFALMLFFTAYSILPSMPTKISFVYVVMLAVAYSVIILINDEKLREPIIIYLLLISLMSVAYFFLVDTGGVSVYASNYFLKKFMAKFNQFFMLFFPAVISARLIMYGKIKQMWGFVLFAYALFAYVVINTLGELVINPNVTKQFQNLDETVYDNIANYYVVYAIPVLIALVIMYFFHSKKNIIRFLLIVAVVFLLYFLIKSQYTLAFLIALIGIYFEFFKRIKSTYNKIIILLLTLIMIFFIPSILKTASELVSSEQMAIRFNEIYNFLVLGDSSGYNLNGRLTLYWKSILAFFKSPFIGNRSLGFNGHATLLTVPADLGLLGLIPFYYMFFKINTHIKTILGDCDYLFAPIFLMILLMGLTNPIHSSTAISITTWAVAPVSIYILFYKKNDDEADKTQNSPIELM